MSRLNISGTCNGRRNQNGTIKISANDLKEVLKGTAYISVDEAENKTYLVVSLDKTKVDEN